MRKIAIIGAGSVTFIASLIKDLAATESLHGIELSLMDIDEERLKMSYQLARRYFDELKVNILVTKTLDRRECIKDAAIVLNTASQISNAEIDTAVRTAEQFNYYRGIDAQEWNMVTNYLTFTGYKNLKIALEVAKDIEELAPSAWMIQIANPVFEITTLVLRQTKTKIIGYCHGSEGGMAFLARKALEIKSEDIQFKVAGFNHVVFLTELKYKGDNGYHLIDEWIKEKSNIFWKDYILGPWEETLSKAAVDMYHLYGLYPLGDTPRSGTWKYHYNLETKERWYGTIGGIDSEIGMAMRLFFYQGLFNDLKNMAFDTKNPVTKKLVPGRTSEKIIDAVDSLLNSVDRRIILNVKNENSIPGLPPDVAVEIPVYINGDGIKPEVVTPLKKEMYLNVLYPRLKRMEYALDAFINGSKEPIVNMLNEDPRTKSERQANEAIEAVFSLPFNKELKNHYK